MQNKSAKRLSIGSMPQSLLGIDSLGDNEPVYLIENVEAVFVELEHHQIVLEELLQNRSAGSFFDEITKWQATLRDIESVLREWARVQTKWARIESVFSQADMQTALSQDANIFYKTDRDFKILMKATKKNNNILKCCQRKSKHKHSITSQTRQIYLDFSS